MFITKIIRELCILLILVICVEFVFSILLKILYFIVEAIVFFFLNSKVMGIRKVFVDLVRFSINVFIEFGKDEDGIYYVLVLFVF